MGGWVGRWVGEILGYGVKSREKREESEYPPVSFLLGGWEKEEEEKRRTG